MPRRNKHICRDIYNKLVFAVPLTQKFELEQKPPRKHEALVHRPETGSTFINNIGLMPRVVCEW